MSYSDWSLNYAEFTVSKKTKKKKKKKKKGTEA
jgi:hypothetical protein